MGKLKKIILATSLIFCRLAYSNTVDEKHTNINKHERMKQSIREGEAFAEQVMGKHSVDPKGAQDFYIEGQQYGTLVSNKPSTYTYGYRKAMPKLYGRSETTIFEFGNMLKEKFLSRARAYTAFANRIEQLEDERLKTINDVTISYYLSNLAGMLVQMKDWPSEECYGLVHINMLRQLYNIN